jgi:putative colanic acid biosynthesis acetyltransferase WcaF
LSTANLKYNTNTHTGPSFSLKIRLQRSLWNVVYYCFFRYSPRPFHEWRSFILRSFGAKVGKHVHIYPGVKIWAPWNLELNDECGVANGAILYSQNKIYLGYRSIISQGAHICTGSHDYTKKGHPLITSPIHIGRQSWIAAEAFIHPGVNIGEGAVIGARSVVTEDMPPWMVCTGHPCKPLKERVFNDR